MKKYYAYIEFFHWEHCIKKIEQISVTFYSMEDLLNKCKQICSKKNLKLVHDYPLAPYRRNGKSAFPDLPATHAKD